MTPKERAIKVMSEIQPLIRALPYEHRLKIERSIQCAIEGAESDTFASVVQASVSRSRPCAD